MNNFSLSNLCPNGTFYIIDYDTESFGDCFIKTSLLIPSYFIFTIINGYIFGYSTDLSRNFKHISIKLLRLITSLLLLSTLITLFVKYFLNLNDGNELNGISISLITDLYQLCSFAIHTVILFNKSVFVSYPIYLLVSFAALTITNFVYFINFLFLNLNNIKSFNLNSYEKFNFISLLSFNLFLFVYNIIIIFSLSNKKCKKSFQVIEYDNVECYVDNNRLVKTESEEDKANYFSYLTFGWLKPIMVAGFMRQIEKIDHLSRIPSDLNVSKVCDRFMSKYWPNNDNEHQNNPILKPDLLLNPEFMENMANEYEDENSLNITTSTQISKKNLASALFRCFGKEFFILGIFKLLNDTINFSGPLLLNQLVQFVETKDSNLKDGCMYATALLISTLIGSLINIHFSNALNKLCLRIKTALITLVYRKAILVRLDQLNKFSTGQIVNYMSIDTDSVVNAFPSFHSFWSLPFQITITLYLLYSQIGISFLVGVAFVIILIPINKVLSDYIGKVQQKLMLEKDSRVKLMTELLNGIRVIKFYSWENYFLNRINKVRERELKQLKAKKYLDAGCVYFWASTPILMSVLTFTTYVLLGNKLTPSKVFTSLALFNMLISPLNSFPWVINGLVQAYVSFKRLQEFLNLKNLNWLTYYSFNELNIDQDNLALDIKNAQFKWKEDEPSGVNEEAQQMLNENVSILGDINLSIRKGNLIGIIGKVGCGKTSLLHAIMAEISKSNGKVRIDSGLCSKGFAYVGQDCWIKAGSIRENILFGAEMNQELYHRVIDACALGPDLDILPQGDETFVGENGISLSGGQKTRLALSRACYAIEKEIYLFDDPLSAVDAHVAKHIYNNCISDLLAHKTRILCTHHIDYLNNADLVLVIENGRIVKSGPGNEIIPSLSDSKKSFKTPTKIKSEEKQAVTEVPDIKDQTKALTEAEINKQEEEEKEHGVINYQVYKYYCLSIGICLTILTLLTLTLMQASRNLTDFWLSYWTQHHSMSNATLIKSSKTLILNPHSIHFYNPKAFFSPHYHKDSTDDTQFFFLIYGALCVANSFFTLFRAFFFAYSGILAGKYIHKRLVDNLSKGNLKFFQNTPTGRILNRISSDMYAIDDSLPFILNIFLANIFGLFGVLAVTCYSLPWFGLSLVPLSIIYYNIQNYYRWTSRELKRLTSISLSPVYTHFHETLGGITTIRAFRQVDRFIKQNETYLSNYIRASYVSMAASQWLNFRLQMISVIMITAVGFTAVFQHIYGTANASLVGLALSYILSVTGLLNGLITSFTETEKEMVSVERAYQFESIEPENWDGIEQVPSNWPVQPSIEYEDVVLQYREDGVNALNGISFKINVGEKIGICGRTGSGKSSLFMALFRGEEIKSGSIKIDDINIRNLSLHDLRNSMSIIPQDPFLFDGSLRENLDPSNSNDDSKLWAVLQKCRLDQKFRSDAAGLDLKIEEKGKNLSSGEKQLVCLARAILANRKILCIDEATASVDFQTDHFIQRTIRQEFEHFTVLTIAHRIDTILDYDKILVLDKGKLIEFDTPKNLLSNEMSAFYSLVNSSKQ